MKLGIGRKVVLSMLVVVLSTMLVIAFYSYSMTKDILIDQVEKELAIKNNNVRQTVSSVFEGKGEIVRQLSSVPVIESFMSTDVKREDVRSNKDYPWIQQVLTNTKNNNENINMIWLVHTENSYFISDHDYVSGPEYSVTERLWYQQASEAEGLSYSRPYRDYLTDEWTISISYPVTIENERLGYFGIYIHLDALANLLEPLETDGQRIVLVSDQGDVLYDPENMWTTLQQETQLEEREQLQLKKDDITYYASLGHLDELGWKIGVYVPEKVVLEPLITYERSIVIVWTIATLVLLVTLSLVLHRLLKDIPFLVRQIKKLKTGNLTVKMGIKRKDEVGEIARAVEQMAMQIKNQVDELDHQASHDSLTGLPNRYSIEKILQQWMHEINTDKEMLVITFLDLDQFKNVNDSKGHVYGDELLIEVGKRIDKNLPSNSFFGRFGGDEFVLIMKANTEADENIYLSLREIHTSLASPFQIFGQEIFTSASMGISLYPSDARTIEDLLIAADTALFKAKELGRNRIAFFTHTMKEQMDKELYLIDGMRQALLKQEFYLQYQPQLDVNSGKMQGMEALIRWKNPKLGFVSPAEFIPLAERTGQIIAIGDWVLDASFQMMKRMMDQGISVQHIGINVSALQLRETNFADKVQQKLTYYKIDPSLIELEITESVIMNHLEETIRKLTKLRQLGIQIALDDFGTGYSSLNYLRLLPIDRVKIDRSFIDRVEDDSVVQAILNTIVTLGHSLGFRIVAEGVEEEAQLQSLTNMKVDTVQGYYYSKPLDAEKLVEFARESLNYHR